ncbi:MAG: hypothetical protein ACOX63_09255 [Christensenellales bacterium]|jgi:hypothetical protein
MKRTDKPPRNPIYLAWMLFLLFLLVTGALIMVFGALTYEPPLPRLPDAVQAALPGIGPSFVAWCAP